MGVIVAILIPVLLHYKKNKSQTERIPPITTVPKNTIFVPKQREEYNEISETPESDDDSILIKLTKYSDTSISRPAADKLIKKTSNQLLLMELTKYSDTSISRPAADKLISITSNKKVLIILTRYSDTSISRSAADKLSRLCS